MLFSNNIEPNCSYCLHGGKISDTEVICIKKGVVDAAGSCRKFIYDPLKREPARHIALDTSSFDKSDFEL